MSDGDGRDGEGGDDGGRSDDGRSESAEGNERDGRGQGQSTAEKVLTGVSVAFTVLLFAYVAWQAVQQPDGTHPQVEIVGTDELQNGSVLVRVELTNPSDQGLVSATVEASCGRPPPDVTFEHVPAGGRDRGVLVCPPGTRPSVSVSAWIPT